MRVLEIGDVRIGEGIPKIIVPIVGESRGQVLEAAASVRDAHPDIVEWRVDWFAGGRDFAQVEGLLADLRAALGGTPLLFTFRTAGEGGRQAIAPGEYADLNIRAIGTGLVDLIDVEAFSQGEVARKIISHAHEAGVYVVASSHDFEKTPDKDELVLRMRKMQDLGADIPKIAVMPRDSSDVLTLLCATREMADQYADRPIITMSMGGKGLASRLCGEAFGSACTFGAVGRASAPGQMDARELGTILRLIHENM